MGVAFFMPKYRRVSQPPLSEKPSLSDEPAVSDKEEMIQQIMRRVEAKLRKDLSDKDSSGAPPTLYVIEEESQTIGEEVKRIIEEERVRDSGDGYAGPFTLCEKGHQARYAGVRTKQVITACGSHSFARAYYHCGQCRGGWCPLDRSLDLGRGQCSRHVRTLVARFCSYLPDRTAAQELEQVCGVRLGLRTLQNCSRAVGKQIQDEWQKDIEKQEKQEKQENKGKTASTDGETLPCSSERPSRLHLTMDGVMLHVDGAWHEAKLGCAYQTSSRGEAIKARYSATLAPSSEFGKRVRVLAHWSGSDHCSDVAVVADGAEWIWQETAKYFPCSTQILDYYHATQHLWSAAHTRFGEGSAEARAWMKEQKERLLNNQAAAIVADLENWHPRNVTKCKIRRQLLGYLKTHKKRTCYKTFSDKGYHIGSGVIESGCKNVVQSRMKGAGMRWSKDGAEAMMALCCHRKSTANGGFYRYTAT
jgi:hypothetical protein